MADAAWKKNERDKSRALGGERRGPTGKDHSDCTPIPLIAPEFKHYKTFQWLEADWRQAAENAAQEGRLPVLSVKERGRGNKRDRVQMEWDAFVFLYWLALLGLAMLGDECACVATTDDGAPPLLRPCPPSLCERPDHTHKGAK